MLGKDRNIKKIKNKYFPIVIVGLLMTSSFIFGILLGSGNLGDFKQIGPIKLKPLILNKEEGKPKNLDFSLFWDAWNSLESNYVGEVDYDKMLYGALKGLSSSFNDPYTVYLDPEESQAFQEEIEGTFSGVGMEIGIKNRTLVVLSPLSGTPAERAGLRTNDKIIAINGESTEGLSIEEAANKIKGPKGTPVKLLMQRGNEDLREVEIIRDNINIESVTLNYNEDIAVIKLIRFEQDTPDSFNKIVDDILIKQPKGIILDLRGNPGGYLSSAVDISSEFLDSGVVTIEELKNGKKKEIKTSKKGRLTNNPLVVLIDQGSASASEIVSGAIRDRGRGKIIGEKSFGKGLVQQVFTLDKGILKITTSKWLTPSGNYINGQGVEPNIKIELTEDDFNNDRDPQLKEAINLLN